MPGGPTRAPTTKKRGGRGRPSSLTEETLQVVERTLLNLGSYDDAAIHAGIHPRTFERWRERGEKEYAAGRDTDYAKFYHRVEQANRKIKQLLSGRVLVASSRDPRFALKILERRFPDWALRQKIDVTDKTPAPASSPRDRLLARMRAIEERQRAAKALLDGAFDGDEK